MKNAELAEICGLHAGDGYLRNNDHRIELDISGNIEEKEFYDSHVLPLFCRYFNIKLRCRYFPHRNTYGFVIRDKHVIEYMHKLGFPYGKKTTIVTIPDFVFNSKENMVKFLRGFFDTDGSISFDNKHKRLHYYPRLTLTTCSKSLALGSCKILNILKIGCWLQIYTPKKPKENIRYKIWIMGNARVEKWFRNIGSKNSSQISRYMIWKKYGFCPPYLTYEQRKQILIGLKNPISFYGPVA